MSGLRAARHAPSRHAATGPGRQIRPQLVRAAVLPTLAAGLSGTAAVIFTLQLGGGTGHRDARLWPVLFGCALLVVGALAAALLGAQRSAKAVRDRCEALRRSSVRGRQELRAAADRLERGEPPARPVRGGPTEPPPGTDPERVDEFWLLSQELRGARELAHTTLVRLAGPAAPSDSDRKVEVFVNLARRLQSLVHREISLLDELEDTVEDPDLLKELFHVDHLATRIRRHAENLAVLGGAASRRQWTRPIDLSEVLRSAVAEVEQYTRVKVVPPAGGTVRGHAVADVVHLLAELVENATVFSAPDTDVVVRAERVTAGIAVEVEDRGLGMPAAEQHRMNSLLVDPDQVSVRHLLADGRIGLFVVSALARRHGIAVELKSNIYGGVLAVLVLPQDLLGAQAPGGADAVNGSRATSWGTGQGGSVAPPLEPVRVSVPRPTPSTPRASSAPQPRSAPSSSAPQPRSAPSAASAPQARSGPSAASAPQARSGPSAPSAPQACSASSADGSREAAPGRHAAPVPVRDGGRTALPDPPEAPAASSADGLREAAAGRHAGPAHVRDSGRTAVPGPAEAPVRHAGPVSSGAMVSASGVRGGAPVSGRGGVGDPPEAEAPPTEARAGSSPTGEAPPAAGSAPGGPAVAAPEGPAVAPREGGAARDRAADAWSLYFRGTGAAPATAPGPEQTSGPAGDADPASARHPGHAPAAEPGWDAGPAQVPHADAGPGHLRGTAGPLSGRAGAPRPGAADASADPGTAADPGPAAAPARGATPDLGTGLDLGRDPEPEPGPGPRPGPAPHGAARPPTPEPAPTPARPPVTVPAARTDPDRPPLPRRRAQSHLAPELRDAPAPRRADGPDQPLHDPGLMAAFRRGFGLAHAEDEA
ncbi:ATP-binding protein [Streptomyces sp. NPDC046876]|uniref:ATP-binding protein n=1 Tax=Streptomyces sp. NPDC046876 TaxID=3155616 RepID=UPI0033EC49BF